MIEMIKQLIFPLLKIGDVRPVPPTGHEQDPHLQIMRAAPSYLRFTLLRWGVQTTVITFIVLMIGSVLLSVNILFLWLLVPLWSIAVFKIMLLYVIARLDYDMRWYIITDRSLFIREGIWTVREITLTFANAQNVYIRQGPIERFLGFANVEVDTAGGGNSKKEEGVMNHHRAIIRGIENAQEVRDRILNLLQYHRTVGLGDPDDRTSPPSSLDTSLLQDILSEAQQLKQTIASVVVEKDRI